MKVHAHLEVRYTKSSFSPSDFKALLRGTPEQLGQYVATTIENAVKHGSVAEISLIPVPAHALWDLDNV